ncbi:NUDIX domain-containing protein [Saccharicrinis sp. FJH54]|uniref:NUDIX hydrolase n=1 Tax=Saccharicrinis sp. FJH54 TaxID=3344665 RepID=UPI0035D3F493
MVEFYKQEHPFILAVDCIIFGFDDEGLKLLLLQRNFEPAKGQWSLMGGFIKEDESADDAAARVLNELTGLSDVYLDQLQVFSEPERDPGARVISLAYSALINIESYDKELVKRHNAHWVKLDELPELIFDHLKMVDKALKRLRRKAASQPIGFNLLPEKFTLTQLQRLYEAIYQREMDKRNFRKKILSMGVLEKLEEKDKISSKRGAFLYRFNEEKYIDLSDENFSFGMPV